MKSALLATAAAVALGLAAPVSAQAPDLAQTPPPPPRPCRPIQAAVAQSLWLTRWCRAASPATAPA